MSDLEYHDPNTSASNPLDIRLSLKKLRSLDPAGHPDVPDKMIDEHLSFGDSRAAVVVSVKPLVVAAYTDEMDCVVLLQFPQVLVARYQLKTGSRLLTINTYARKGGRGPDIVPGPNGRDTWINFDPQIADFLTDDLEVVEARKAQIGIDEWRRAEAMGRRKLEAQPHHMRNGSPYWSFAPISVTGAPVPGEGRPVTGKPQQRAPRYSPEPRSARRAPYSPPAFQRPDPPRQSKAAKIVFLLILGLGVLAGGLAGRSLAKGATSGIVGGAIVGLFAGVIFASSLFSEED